MSYNVVGKSFPRHDVLQQVTGRIKYAEDYNMPGMLFAKALRSGYSHARIVDIDISEAESNPKVKGVITARDVPHNRYGFTHQDQPVIADTKVSCCGDVIAVVAATSWQAAEEALSQIKVIYEPLPAVFDPREAMEPGAPIIHGDSNIAAHVKIRKGNILEGLHESDRIIEETIVTQMVEHAHIEPHAGLAYITSSGEIEIIASVQRPFLIASDLGKILKMPLNRIRVIYPAIGGGFGGKMRFPLNHIYAFST